MILSSDQQLDAEHLSANARRMLELRDAVFSEWEKRVRAQVKDAERLAHPILINTFPALYANLAQAITPSYPRTAAGAISSSVASEHGGERARLTDYDAKAVISEYQILRWALFDILAWNNVHFTPDESLIINGAIDIAIREAINAFTLAQAGFREQFMATLAHDLRNPLAAAHVAAEMIVHSDGPERTLRLAHQVTENLARMDRMIQELLDSVMFQQGERLKLHPVSFDMMEVVREVIDQFIASNGQRFEVTGNPVTGWWGREPIRRALENLLSNALKYGAPGTPIRIALAEAHERVILSVHNEGEPIPPDQVENIFQVFRRAKAAREGDKRGWGIGLPYVRSVAESHGGSVGVDSSAERGTTFLIDIPVDSRPYQNAPTLAQVTGRDAQS